MKECPLVVISTPNKSQIKFYIKLQNSYIFELDLLFFLIYSKHYKKQL